MDAKIRILGSGVKVTEIKSNIKEIKSEKKKEISGLEKEVSNESIIESMPSGDLNPALRAEAIRNQAEQADFSGNQSNKNSRDIGSSRVAYSEPGHSNLEAKYQLNTLESQRTQNLSVMQRSNDQQSTRLGFDNPELMALRNRGQETGEHYEGRISTGEVSVKRRREWER